MATLGFIRKSSSLLEALRDGNDCPVCLLCDEDLRYFYRWYFIEYYHDTTWIDRTLNSRGFCNRHSWDLIRMGKGHEMSVVYEYLVKSALVKLGRLYKELKKYKPESRINKVIRKITGKKHIQRLEEAKKQLEPSETCPICKSISNKATEWIHNLIMDLEDERVKGLYYNSQGLCMNHFNQAIKFASPKSLEILIQKQVEVLRKLNDDLEEYWRKTDYRYSHESKGKEQTAWIRAIKFFVGKEL
ncbi:MAG: hypothetical protein C4291_05765 [Candidatus Dadabacteria bacterium]